MDHATPTPPSASHPWLDWISAHAKQMARAVWARIERATSICLGFVRVSAEESSTRLVAVVCMAVGAAIGLSAVGLSHAAAAIASANPKDSGDVVRALGDMVKAEAVLSGVFVVQGAVALVKRTPVGASGDNGKTDRADS